MEFSILQPESSIEHPALSTEHMVSKCSATRHEDTKDEHLVRFGHERTRRKELVYVIQAAR
ncbi:hypothetical protein D1BOALGB6SA_5701 [Olavius sp. associated proteobacterium Delta 1]|nr:hypothetical protein D1BOALGB6SA_5701 [Olavius sp. associated proteobacterium Delta 1]